jgi:transcriptional regulator GlxA family with amidase domain
MQIHLGQNSLTFNIKQQIGPIGPELDALRCFLLAASLRLMQQVQPNDHPDWLSRILAHIHEHIGQPITMEQLADLASCSRGHFHRQFHQATDEMPLHYLSRHRMERALQHLRQTQWPIKTIAAKSGFPDPLYFSRCFRKAFGRSPNQARNNLQV